MNNFKKIFNQLDEIEVYDNSRKYHQMMMSIKEKKIVFKENELPVWLSKTLEIEDGNIT